MAATDIPPVDIWGLLFEQTPPFPDNHILFQSPTTQYTLNDVRHRATRFGHALQRQWSWQKGDVLVVMAPNHIDVPIVTWGCHWAGGVVAPVNPGLTVPELQQQLQRSRARGIVVHAQGLPTVLEAARQAHLPLDRVVVLSDSGETTNITELRQFMNHASSPPPLTRTPIDPAKDTAFLVYSSGTTGRPKGVMISHRNVVAGVVLQDVVDGSHVHHTRDRILACLPIYHIYGLICQVHLPAYLGLRTVFLEKFDLDTFCQLVQSHAITHAYVAPPIVLHLAKHPSISNYNLRSIRMLTSGGAPLAPNLIAEVHARLGIPVRQAYGLSETTAVCHIQNWKAHTSTPGSNGPPLPTLSYKFTRADNSQIPQGSTEEGELHLQGPTIFTGYLDDPESTRASLTPLGWFRTGDIGYADKEGNLYITDRAKDLIKVKGYAVAPAELEDVVLSCDGVEDAAVVGIMNADLGSELPLAYVVVSPGLVGDETFARKVIRHVQDRVVAYKQLRGGVVFTDVIPRSPSGKILKRELRVRLEGADKGKVLGAVQYARYRDVKL